MPRPETWIVDDKAGTATLDHAESVRIYALITWSFRQLARCKDAQPPPGSSP